MKTVTQIIDSWRNGERASRANYYTDGHTLYEHGEAIGFTAEDGTKYTTDPSFAKAFNVVLRHAGEPTNEEFLLDTLISMLADMRYSEVEAEFGNLVPFDYSFTEELLQRRYPHIDIEARINKSLGKLTDELPDDIEDDE